MADTISPADTISAIEATVEDVGEVTKKKAEDIAGAVKEQARERIAKSTDVRVEESTPEEINRQIRRDLKARVLYFAERPEEINRRLDELDREWDIERLLQLNAGALLSSV